MAGARVFVEFASTTLFICSNQPFSGPLIFLFPSLRSVYFIRSKAADAPSKVFFPMSPSIFFLYISATSLPIATCVPIVAASPVIRSLTNGSFVDNAYNCIVALTLSASVGGSSPSSTFVSLAKYSAFCRSVFIRNLSFISLAFEFISGLN